MGDYLRTVKPPGYTQVNLGYIPSAFFLTYLRTPQFFYLPGEKKCIAIYVNSSQSYGAPSAMWDHAVLPASRLRYIASRLNSSQADSYLIYLPRDSLSVRRYSPIQFV